MYNASLRRGLRGFAARCGGDTAPVQDAPANTSPSAHATPSARRAFDLVGLVVAPTTLVTGLAFYFGWVLTNARASYFGIDASAFGFSTQDYILRSTDALFVPLGGALVLGLAMVWLHALALRLLDDRADRARLRVAARAGAAVGVAVFAIGAVAVVDPGILSLGFAWSTACPGIGIALLAYALALLGRIDAIDAPQRSRAGQVGARRPAGVLVVLLIVVSAFATTAGYAQTLGRERAVALAGRLGELPRVTVFAPQRLAIAGGGVVERRLTGPGQAYRYRYSGLRMLVRSDGKYFLLPDGWTHDDGTAIVIRDDPRYRFAFGAGGGRSPAANGGDRGAIASARTRGRGPIALPGPVATTGPSPDMVLPTARLGKVAVGASRRLRGSVRAAAKGQAITRFEVLGGAAGEFSIDPGSCRVGAEIAAGHSCEYAVVFAPKEVGTRRARIVVSLRVGASRSRRVEGRGTLP
jgi:hypothetical protein